MKTALRSQVTESFRSPLTASTGSQDTLASRIKDAQVQLEALQKITHNEFKQKVRQEYSNFYLFVCSLEEQEKIGPNMPDKALERILA